MNQTASIGSTVTFNCTATGHPKPTITWTKDNDAHSVQSSPRAQIITDYDKSLSQLVITGVTRKDYGIYQCVANNSAGVKASRGAFLYPGTVGKIVIWLLHKISIPLLISHERVFGLKLFPNP